MGLPLEIKTIHKQVLYFFAEGQKLDLILCQAERGEEDNYSINSLLFRALAYENNSVVKGKIIQACSGYDCFSQEAIADLLLNGSGQPYLESSRESQRQWVTLCKQPRTRIQVVKTIEKLGSEQPSYRVARSMMTAMENLQDAILQPTPLFKELVELFIRVPLLSPVWKVLARRLNWESTQNLLLEQTSAFYVAARIRQMAQEETRYLTKLVNFAQLLALVEDACFVKSVMELAEAREIESLPQITLLEGTDPRTAALRTMTNSFS